MEFVWRLKALGHRPPDILRPIHLYKVDLVTRTDTAATADTAATLMTVFEPVTEADVLLVA